MHLTDWSVTSTAPDAISEPGASLRAGELAWISFSAPGTVAGALEAAGQWSIDRDDVDLESSDWWFRTSFDRPPTDDRDVAGWSVRFAGIATLAEVWCNGVHMASSSNMFRSVDIDVTEVLAEHNELVVRCSALRPLLGQRRPRPRWKTTLVEDQQLRWFRTSLQSRIPSWGVNAPIVGLWRPVELVPVAASRFELESLRASLDTTDVDSPVGRIRLRGRLVGAAVSGVATLTVGHATSPVHIGPDGVIDATVDITDPEPWWPHTHGDPRTHSVALQVGAPDGGLDVDLGSVGFRTVEFGPVDAPVLRVNGVEIFARGVCWNPVDPIGLNPSSDRLRQALTQLRDAGMNMVRIQATTVYESAEFHELCDELGLMVWQDLMFVRMDYPTDDEVFDAQVRAEVGEVLSDLSAHPSLTVVCGGCEIGQQAAMMGRPAAPGSIIGSVLAELIGSVVPDVAYLDDTPIGGPQPFTANVGVSNYFGVGAYRRPLTDATLSGVRFASECLAFSTVPCDESIEELTSAGVGLHDPRWKRAVVRDRAAPWDFEDIRDHYVHELFGVDPQALRLVDPARYLDLGRAAVAHASADTFAQWRVPTSACGGGLVLQGRDVRLGAGAGIVDSAGRPKATWYALRRVLQSSALLLRDEGLNGLDVWVLNDGPSVIDSSLAIQAYSGESNVADVVESFVLEAHSARRFNAEQLLGSFFDVTYAYRFGPEPLSAVAAQWYSDGDLIARAVHRPVLGPIERGDPGLVATSRQVGPDSHEIEVNSRGFAQCVMVDAGPASVSDNAFDIEPGGVVRLTATSASPVRGRVRALNATTPAPIIQVHD